MDTGQGNRQRNIFCAVPVLPTGRDRDENWGADGNEEGGIGEIKRRDVVFHIDTRMNSRAI